MILHYELVPKDAFSQYLREVLSFSTTLRLKCQEVLPSLRLSERVRLLQVARVIHAILGKAVAPSEPLTVAGLDSLGALEVQKELSR